MSPLSGHCSEWRRRQPSLLRGASARRTSSSERAPTRLRSARVSQRRADKANATATTTRTPATKTAPMPAARKARSAAIVLPARFGTGVREPVVLLAAWIAESHLLKKQPRDHAAMFSPAKDAPTAPPQIRVTRDRPLGRPARRASGHPKPAAVQVSRTLPRRPLSRRGCTRSALDCPNTGIIRWPIAAIVALEHDSPECAAELADTLARLLTICAFAHAGRARIVSRGQ